MKLNFLQYPSNMNDLSVKHSMSLQALHTNEEAQGSIEAFKHLFGFASLNTFSFSKEGFLGLFLTLKGKIAVSLGESQAIIDGALLYQNLGFEVDFIPITKCGKLDYDAISKCDYAFVSSYIMDTFVCVDLKRVKELSQAVIVSNGSATLKKDESDMLYFDAYKLTSFALSGVLLHDKKVPEQYLGSTDMVAVASILQACKTFGVETSYKMALKKLLDETFKENIYYFVDVNTTLEYTLHFGLKGIKAREIIRTLSLSNIFVSNGEGCSLGLSKPSRVLQAMGYEEEQARWALSLNFNEPFTQEELSDFVQTLAKKYRQIKALGQ